MLSYVFSDTMGNEIIMPAPLSVVLRMEEGVPAHDLNAVFPYTECGELRSVAVYDEGETVFVGMVDEEERIISGEGEYLRISARSLAAHMLDNEAQPQSYDHPSADLMYERYAQPYGIKSGDVDESTYLGELIIPKGTSCWDAVKSFCKACYSSSPAVSADGRLFMRGLKNDDIVRFGGGESEIPFISLSEKKKRCEEISRVNIKTANSDGYRGSVENADAVDRGICRERYINAALTATPMKTADIMIRNGAESSYIMKLRCPGRTGNILGMNAEVSFSAGRRGGLYISGIRYHMDSKSDYTDVELKRRDPLCGLADI